MHRNYKVLYTVLVLCLTISFFAQEVSAQRVAKEIVKVEQKRDQMHIRFRVSESNIDPNYMSNADSLQRIVEWVDQVQKDSMVDIVGVEFCGAASPEGSAQINRRLSDARLRALEKYVRDRIYIPENIIVRNDHYIAWDELADMVEESNLANKQEVLAIINSENRSEEDEIDSRINDLKRLDGGKTWEKLYNLFFVDMRNAYTVLVTQKSQIAIEYERMLREPLIAGARFMANPTTIAPNIMSIPEATIEKGSDMRYMYIKTNLIGLGLLIGNLGLEFDMGRYFSISLPVYYSALDYFSPTTKFRTFAVQPELRIWPMQNKDGLFIGAHAGFAYYNLAFNGDWRYQDHNGTTPTIGGGLSIGYRFPISRNKRWKLELAVGAGVYPLHYDVFHNLDNGQLYETRKNTYVGLDNATIGISYRIPLKEVQPKK